MKVVLNFSKTTFEYFNGIIMSSDKHSNAPQYHPSKVARDGKQNSRNPKKGSHPNLPQQIQQPLPVPRNYAMKSLNSDRISKSRNILPKKSKNQVSEEIQSPEPEPHSSNNSQAIARYSRTEPAFTPHALNDSKSIPGHLNNINQPSNLKKSKRKVIFSPNQGKKQCPDKPPPMRRLPEEPNVDSFRPPNNMDPRSKMSVIQNISVQPSTIVRTNDHDNQRTKHFAQDSRTQTCIRSVHTLPNDVNPSAPYPNQNVHVFRHGDRHHDQKSSNISNSHNQPNYIFPQSLNVTSSSHGSRLLSNEHPFINQENSNQPSKQPINVKKEVIRNQRLIEKNEYPKTYRTVSFGESYVHHFENNDSLQNQRRRARQPFLRKPETFPKSNNDFNEDLYIVENRISDRARQVPDIVPTLLSQGSFNYQEIEKCNNFHLLNNFFNRGGRPHQLKEEVRTILRMPQASCIEELLWPPRPAPHCSSSNLLYHNLETAPPNGNFIENRTQRMPQREPSPQPGTSRQNPENYIIFPIMRLPPDMIKYIMENPDRMKQILGEEPSTSKTVHIRIKIVCNCGLEVCEHIDHKHEITFPNNSHIYENLAEVRKLTDEQNRVEFMSNSGDSSDSLETQAAPNIMEPPTPVKHYTYVPDANTLVHPPIPIPTSNTNYERCRLTVIRVEKLIPIPTQSNTEPPRLSLITPKQVVDQPTTPEQANDWDPSLEELKLFFPEHFAQPPQPEGFENDQPLAEQYESYLPEGRSMFSPAPQEHQNTGYMYDQNLPDLRASTDSHASDDEKYNK